MPRTTHAALALALVTALAVPREARSFCGFYVSGSSEGLYNRATRVALMRHGTRTVLSMSNDYEGPPQDFAMVVPVPVVLHRDQVRTLPRELFAHLEQLTGPRLVEYWEQDPCTPLPPPDAPGELAFATEELSAPSRGRDLGVRVEARFAVGEYDVVVLSASQSNGLETWLHENHYNIPQGAAAYLAPYVRGDWKFFVARVDIQRVQRLADGRARLSPLRFHYDSTEFRLPVRLGLLNARDAQDLIVYVLSPDGRYETSNLRNVFVPTNLDVTDAVKANFPAFYAQLFDATLQSAGQRAVVTEYAWQASSCDPCPGPVMDGNDLATLGADVLDAGDPAQLIGMVVTRLHARYNAATLTDDLVFRVAPPVVGGREFIVDANGGLEQGARTAPSGANNFQARYAIRHRWTGPIQCANPRRGMWGSDPSGASSSNAPQAATDLAVAPRGALDLHNVVLTAVPGVDLGARLTLPPAPPPSQPGGPAVIPSHGIQHCGCRAVGARGRRGVFVVAALAGLACVARRRRR